MVTKMSNTFFLVFIKTEDVLLNKQVEISVRDIILFITSRVRANMSCWLNVHGYVGCSLFSKFAHGMCMSVVFRNDDLWPTCPVDNYEKKEKRKSYLRFRKEHRERDELIFFVTRAVIKQIYVDREPPDYTQVRAYLSFRPSIEASIEIRIYHCIRHRVFLFQDIFAPKVNLVLSQDISIP